MVDYVESSDMFSRIEWVKPVDIAILSLLSGPKSLELTPGNIARNIEYHPDYVSKRGKLLAEKGLLKVSQDGTAPYFSITGFGARVLNNEVSVEALEKLADDDPDDE